MNQAKLETAVGVFVVVGVICLGWLSFKLGKKELIGGNYYSVYADFDSISGLRPNGEIEIAGVVVGRIAGIGLADSMARVEMKIEKHIQIPEDTIVSVKTRGLIGDKILSLSIGGSDAIIPAGGSLIETESALDLEEILSKYVFGEV